VFSCLSAAGPPPSRRLRLLMGLAECGELAGTDLDNLSSGPMPSRAAAHGKIACAVNICTSLAEALQPASAGCGVATLGELALPLPLHTFVDLSKELVCVPLCTPYRHTPPTHGLIIPESPPGTGSDSAYGTQTPSHAAETRDDAAALRTPPVTSPTSIWT
jgi:hypothetical protein